MLGTVCWLPGCALPAPTSLSRTCWPWAAARNFQDVAKTSARFRPQCPWGDARPRVPPSGPRAPRVPSNRQPIAAESGRFTAQAPPPRAEGRGEGVRRVRANRLRGLRPEPAHWPRAARRRSRKAGPSCRKAAGEQVWVSLCPLCQCHWAPRTSGEGTAGGLGSRTAMAGALVRKAADYVRSKDFRDYLMR